MFQSVDPSTPDWREETQQQQEGKKRTSNLDGNKNAPLEKQATNGSLSFLILLDTRKIVWRPVGSLLMTAHVLQEWRTLEKQARSRFVVENLVVSKRRRYIQHCGHVVE
jgi:hypothetical protein